VWASYLRRLCLRSVWVCLPRFLRAAPVLPSPGAPHRGDARGPLSTDPMSRKDQLTGKGPVAGHHVSHANNKAKRRFEVNLQKKRFFDPETGRWVTLRVSGTTIKTINKKGIAAVLRDARKNGVSV